MAWEQFKQYNIGRGPGKRKNTINNKIVIDLNNKVLFFPKGITTNTHVNIFTDLANKKIGFNFTNEIESNYTLSQPKGKWCTVRSNNFIKFIKNEFNLRSKKITKKYFNEDNMCIIHL